jgi:predicted dehydrogenase
VTYRVAIVGCGRVGTRFHAPAFAAQPDCQIVACVGRTLDKAQTLAATYGATAYADLESMLDDARPDIVVIATPDTAHLEALERSLARGLHVFVEKPLHAAAGQERVTWDDFLIAEAALGGWDRTKSLFGMNFNYRTMPHVRQLKADADSGALGTIRLVDALAHLNCWSHTLDLLRWIVGDIVEVFAQAAQDAATLDRVVALRFAGVANGSLVGAAFNFRDDLIRLDLFGSDARGTVEALNGSYRRRPERPGEPEVVWPRRDLLNDNYGPSFKATIDAYCEAVRAGRQPPVDGDDGLAELAVEAAISRSAQTNTPVVVPYQPRRNLV